MLSEKEQHEVLAGYQHLKANFVQRILDGRIKVDYRGHCGQQLTGPVSFTETAVFSMLRENYSDDKWVKDHLQTTTAFFLQAALMSKITLDRMRSWVNIEETVPYKAEFNPDACTHCGQRLDVYFDGKTITYVTRGESLQAGECEHPGGLKDYTVCVDIPSGELIVANDLRDVVPEADLERYVNYDHEIMNTVKDYAAVNMLFFFVGNSCPGIWQIGNTLAIGNCAHDDDNNEIPLIEGAIEVNSVCTDLWWVSAADKDLLREAGLRHFSEAEYNEWLESQDHFVVHVEPGKYELTVHTKARDADWNAKTVYATLNRQNGG